MTELVAGGILGMLLGIAVQCCGLSSHGAVARAMALHNFSLTRRVLMALGWAVVLTAFLSYLAVIDGDKLIVLPLHGGTILGGAIFGAAAGLTGILPGTAPAVLGGGRFLPGACAMAGCFTGSMLLPGMQGVFAHLQGMVLSASTVFRVTLDEPYLLGGGFLGQGCIGAALMLLAMALPADKAAPLQEIPATQEPKGEQEPISTEAEDVQEDTVVALLPGEEAVVVDAAAPEEAQEDAAIEEESTSEENEEQVAEEEKEEHQG